MATEYEPSTTGWSSTNPRKGGRHTNHRLSRRAVTCLTTLSLVSLFALVRAEPVEASSSSMTASLFSTMTVSPQIGPVGTVVKLQGNAGPGCGLNNTGLEFTDESGEDFERIVPRVAANGTWTATFVIPPYFADDSTQGGSGVDVTTGSWDFESVAPCDGTGFPIEVEFFVTGPFSYQPPSRFVGIAATPDGKGYWLAQSGGGVFAYGSARFYGSIPGRGIKLAAPIAAVAATPDGKGYWLASEDGGVFAFGDARFYGSLPARMIHPHAVIVGISPTPDGKGYWLLGADGGVFAFGDARFYGTAGVGLANVAMSPTHDGKGYFVFRATGDRPAIEGDAALPAAQLNQTGPTVMDALLSDGVATADGGGDWEVGTDGGVFSYGDAHFYGSLPGVGISPTAPIVGIAPGPGDRGYWLLGADGGVFAFGDAVFHGSAARSGLSWLAPALTLPVLEIWDSIYFKPTAIGLSADAGNIVSGITWASWTSTEAVGYGTWTYDNCIPSCAAGSTAPYPATIVLFDPIGGKFTMLTETTGGPYGVRSFIFTVLNPEPGYVR